jgi:hypothetical protein
MELNKFPHIVLINNADVKRKDLSGGILHFIADFEKSYKGYMLKPTELGLQKLKEKSDVIAQHIYDYFVEDDEQIDDPSVAQMVNQVKDAVNDEPAPNPAPNPAPAPIDDFTPENKDESILHELFKSNITTVTKDFLKEKGFNTSMWGRLNSKGAIYKTYFIVPVKLFSTTYTINKK